jgi:hypothetical protein
MFWVYEEAVNARVDELGEAWETAWEEGHDVRAE